ncbi:MAG: hypothetical protein Kow0092_14830 [Deferrisomatales bacterium]
MKPEAEALRVRYLYRSLILKGRLDLPPDAARALVGPDCAYRLYRVAERWERRVPPRPPGR